MRLLTALLGVLVACSVAAEETSIFGLTLKARECVEREHDGPSCTFSLPGLEFSIDGIGSEWVAFTVSAADFDKGFYITVGVGMHDCIVVKTLRDEYGFDLPAFVGPDDARVYRDWVTCKQRKGGV